LAIGLFSVLWLDLIRLLSTQWEAREQYAYGWFVPFFAAALLWRRWLDRPGREPQDQSRTGPPDQAAVRVPPARSPVVRSPVVLFLFSAFCFLLLPLRVIYEINTDWPLIAWLYTLIVVALTLYAFHLADPAVGRSPVVLSSRSPSSLSGPVVPWSCGPSSVSGPVVLWSCGPVVPWSLHFAFPICFILVAVVWPYRIEKGLTQDLMQVVANITVEILGWLDIPAIQRGNLIELSTGTVGIDEACSGIRSFQSSLMAGLLMGELYRMKFMRRLALVVCGLALGFCFNVVRTTLLSWQANAHGLHALEKWHDPAGMTITVACFFALWALAMLITKRSPSPGPVGGPVVRGPVVRGPSSGPVVSWSCSPVVLRYLTAVGLWSLLCILTTELWYRSHIPKDSGVFHWSVALPQEKPDFQKLELAPRTIKLLKYDVAATGKWHVDDGSEWSVNFFRWLPRSIESVINSRTHRPEVCLPAAGLRQVSASELIHVDAADLKIPFRKYTYELDGRNLYVFFCQWEDGAASQAGMQSSGQEDRLQSVLKGRRLVGQQTLEIIVSDCPSLDQAEQGLRKDLPALIRTESPLRVSAPPPAGF
jgi:exosortase